MRIPFAFLKGSSGGGGVFNPVTDGDPDGYWRASFGGVPWTPTATTGTSGSNGNLTTAGVAPTVGTALDGFDPAALNGTTQGFGLDTAVASDVLAFDAMTMIILAKTNGSVAADANFYNDPALITSGGGNHALVYTSSGVRFGVFDSTSRQTPFIAQSTGVWFMAAGRLDGTSVKCRVASGGVTTDATPATLGSAPGGLSANVLVGKNYAATAHAAADVLEIVLYKRALADAELADWEAYFNDRYPSAGL